jgi:hypothetical protein
MEEHMPQQYILRDAELKLHTVLRVHRTWGYLQKCKLLHQKMEENNEILYFSWVYIGKG